MEKGQGKRTDTLQTDKVFTRKEYIEREAALTEFAKVCDIFMALMARPTCGECSVADTVRKIKHIAAADVVARDCYDRLLAENDELRKERPVRHGRWDDKVVAFYRKCSECGCCVEWDKKPFLFGDGEYNFCPNCGARMDGDSE